MDEAKEYEALITDLSKAFDFFAQHLIIAELHAYGFSIKSLESVKDYLTERKQRIKMKDQSSSWLDILYGVPQNLFCLIYLSKFF